MTYYVGQWATSVNPELSGNFVSKFAKVIRIEELCTNIANRYYRSFKITVESYSSKEMIKASNWPGNIKIEQWHFKLRKSKANKKKTIKNPPITKGDALRVNNETDVTKKVCETVVNNLDELNTILNNKENDNNNENNSTIVISNKNSEITEGENNLINKNQNISVPMEVLTSEEQIPNNGNIVNNDQIINNPKNNFNESV